VMDQHETESTADLRSQSCGCQTKVSVYDIEDTDSAADKLEQIQEEFKKVT